MNVHSNRFSDYHHPSHHHRPHLLGKAGEDEAVRYLLSASYLIIDRNWRGSKGELDIIARSPDDHLAFIEVKTRSSLRFGDPFEAISAEKYRRLYQLAREWISLHAKAATWQIDVILLLKNDVGFELVHHKGLIA